MREWVRVVLSGLALAQATAAHAGDWTFTVAPYAWGAGLEGGARHTGLPPVASRRSASDVLSSLDWAAMGSLQARRERFVLFADLLHAQLGEAATVPVAGVAARWRVRAGTTLLAAGYRLVDARHGQVDLFAGARAWSLDSRVAIGAPVDRGARAGMDWLDPLLGIMARWSPGDRWILSGWLLADPAGDATDAMAALGYRIGERASLHLGWRHLSLARRGSRLAVDADLAGPGLGLEYRF